ncbi:hypothetical protein I317_05159 [Kwoniella heveanensis CBS 569]|nr:hypothetical protein I317_05159 [Kwoniella heveanensis CBS 569]
MVFTALLKLSFIAPLVAAIPNQAVFTPEETELSVGGEIDTWALNPTGDAAIIRVARLEDSSKYDLHLLAINAQYTIPSVNYGPTDPHALYTFVSDNEFITLVPSHEDEDVWNLFTQKLEYTTLPPAKPPTASEPKLLKRIELPIHGRFEDIIYASHTDTLVAVIKTGTPEYQTSGLFLSPLGNRSVNVIEDQRVNEQVSAQSGIVFRDLVTNGTHLVFTAASQSSDSSPEQSDLWILDLNNRDRPMGVFRWQAGVSFRAPAFGVGGTLAWLTEDKKNGKVQLWIHDGKTDYPIKLKNFGLSPEKAIWAKNGEALYLLTTDADKAQKSLYHLFTPSSGSPPVEPIRIPSNGTIDSAIHIGVTPLDHAHLIGVKEDARKGEGKELWVISHSPHEDPTYNYENIRLTHFTD